MSNENASADPLADLGLDLGDDTSTEATVDTAEGTAVEETAASTDESTEVAAESADAPKKTRQAVKVGDVEFEQVDLIPSIKRGGGGNSGSKYKFDELKAPVAKEEGDGFLYSTFKVNNVEGQDLVLLKRSVQSAVSQQNRQHKDQNSSVRYITRSLIVDGEDVGIIVYRVDDTIAEETETA